MERENDSLPYTGGSYGTSGSTTLVNPFLDNDQDLLNTDEQSLTDVPLRSDLETGMSADVSAGVASGRDFAGNLDSDTDAGLAVANPDAYTFPAAINENNDPIQEPAKISEPIDSAKSALTTAADTAKAQASQLADQAKTQISALTTRATETVKDQIGAQKSKAADNLGAVSQAVHQTADSLHQNGQGQFGTVAHTVADKIDGLTTYLRDKDVDQIAGEISDYAKQNPQLFIGGAFLLGIAFARFLKSSQRTEATPTAASV